MALVLKDRVKETGTANTTVSFTLTGASTGFQDFSAIGNGNTTFYAATDASGNWEAGIGTYSTTGPTLTRTTILSSSNSNTAVTFSGGVSVFVTYPSEKSVNLDGAGNVTGLGTVSSGTWQGSTVGVAYGGTGVTASTGPNSVALRDVYENIQVNAINQALEVTTSSGGITDITLASAHFQILIGTSAHTYRMPDATTEPVGAAWIFDNDSTQNLTVTNNAGATIDVVPPGGYSTVFLELAGTVAGIWGRFGMLPNEVNWGTNSLDLGGSTVITNGTWQGNAVAPAYGGTGLTGFVASNNALYSSGASTLTAGTLPLLAGGTGATTASTARTNLGLGSTDDVTFDEVTATKIKSSTYESPNPGVVFTTSATNSPVFFAALPSADATGINEFTSIQLNGNANPSDTTTLNFYCGPSGASVGTAESTTSGPVPFTINNGLGSSFMRFDGSDYIGINNLSPTTALDVTGTITATDMAFQTYSEKVETVGTIATSTYNLDLSLANVFDITLGTNVTLTFTNPVASGVTKPITLIVRQPASSPGKTLTVTGAQYTDGVTPILSTGANQKDVLSYWSIDGGTTYFGTFAMANVS